MSTAGQTRFFAHTLPDCGQELWEPLEDHLHAVAALAAGFASEFGAGGLGHLAGLWHDLGKFSLEFQGYLGVSEFRSRAVGKVDHSTAGAQHAVQALNGAIGRFLAYSIAGHHAGLPDANTESNGSLETRLKKRICSIAAAPDELLKQGTPPLPPFQYDSTEPGRAFQAGMFCRFLFSCLVDADYLATEQFVAPTRSASRMTSWKELRELEQSVTAHLNSIVKEAERSPVNDQRRTVLKACNEAAKRSPGIFSLTVPTGGGKTLSSLLFGLKHARLNGLRRVIYAIPFTSIIEQNARVFREALATCGDDVVLEHHSNFDPEQRDDDEILRSRLATENWDAPVVVTTNVQFFESLFASRPSRCRKLHRIVGSVIILDEVQTIPVEVLKPCLAALRELALNYRCSIVLCSATQPAVARRDDFQIGLEDVHEIIPDRADLFNALRRVNVQTVGNIADAELVDRLLKHPQALVVVNTKRHAATLHQALRAEGRPCIHLSAFMCPEHRSERIAEIRECLRSDDRCIVVSTQLIEAGVDLDFPVVYRALAGLDSIAQAAGRCNREGKLERGQVYVFEPEGGVPAGFIRQTAQTASELIDRYDDLLGLDAIEHYFDLHYWKRRGEWDKHRVLDCFMDQGRVLNFREAAERFKIIPDETESVIIPWGERGKATVERLRSAAPHELRDAARLVQRFSVQLRRYDWMKLRDSALEQVHERFWVLARRSLYDEEVGLKTDAGEVWEPTELIT